MRKRRLLGITVLVLYSLQIVFFMVLDHWNFETIRFSDQDVVVQKRRAVCAPVHLFPIVGIALMPVGGWRLVITRGDERNEVQFDLYEDIDLNDITVSGHASDAVVYGAFDEVLAETGKGGSGLVRDQEWRTEPDSAVNEAK